MTESVFTLDPVPEIHLACAPLVKVLMQVQFSRTPELISDHAERRLAERLRRYPVRRHGTTFDVSVGLVPGLVQRAETPVRVFTEPTGAWQVSVTETSVALETATYDTRDDFCQRAREVLDAAASVALPPIVDRVGLRYVDRLQGEALARLHNYIEPPLRVLHGMVGADLEVEHSVSDTLIRLADDERLRVRSGLLPPGGSFDPVLPLASEPSWVLDLDVFTVRGGFPFDPERLDERLRRYAAHMYAFFRFATTDAFQEDFKAPAGAPSGGRLP